MATGQGIGAAVVFVGALALILVRPRRLPEWVSALGGALAMLLLGAVGPAQAAEVVLDNWNAFLFFLGMLLVAAVADRAGVFGALAGLAARRAGGSGPRLLLNILLLGAGVTAVLSNDATALLLTPVVFALVIRLGLPPRPYAFACSFVANAASLLLPVSNPANLLVLGAAPLGFGAFLRHLAPGTLAALLVTFAGLRLVFRRDLAIGFRPEQAPTAPPVGARFRVTLACLVALAAAYIGAAALGLPLGAVALAGAVVLLLGQASTGGLEPGPLAREVAWGIFPFLAGMLVLVKGIENAGLSALAGTLFARAVAGGGLGALLLTAGGAALGANVINNLPMALVAASTLAGAPDPATRPALVAAALFGVDLGPNLTVVGSLSTMLWLLLLRHRGLDVSGLDYLRLGVLILPPALLAAVLTLWLTTLL